MILKHSQCWEVWKKKVMHSTVQVSKEKEKVN